VRSWSVTAYRSAWARPAPIREYPGAASGAGGAQAASRSPITRYFRLAISVVIPLLHRLQFVVRRENSIDPLSNEFAA
jgi:hypothetical protein